MLLWTCAVAGLVLLTLIVMLIRRERSLHKQLAECHELIARLSEARNDRQDGDAERFKRSQYFARIGTWDWDVDTQALYWSDAIYGMFGFKIGEVTPSYALFCSCVHRDDRAQVRAGELRCLETGDNHDEEYRVVWPDGSTHWIFGRAQASYDTGTLSSNAAASMSRVPITPPAPVSRASNRNIRTSAPSSSNTAAISPGNRRRTA